MFSGEFRLRCKGTAFRYDFLANLERFLTMFGRFLDRFSSSNLNAIFAVFQPFVYKKFKVAARVDTILKKCSTLFSKRPYDEF